MTFVIHVSINEGFLLMFYGSKHGVCENIVCYIYVTEILDDSVIINVRGKAQKFTPNKMRNVTV